MSNRRKLNLKKLAKVMLTREQLEQAAADIHAREVAWDARQRPGQASLWHAEQQETGQ